jgi:dihydrofolate reductase
MNPRISVIAAIGKNNRAICEGQNLLWVIPSDHKRLREKTLGHTLVMGRNTYDSIGKPLPGRISVVMTRNPNYIPPNYDSSVVKIAHSSEEALDIAKMEEIKLNPENPEVFIFGGAQIYEQTLNSADRLYLTVVDSDREGTAHFPEYSQFTKVLFEEEHTDLDKNKGEPIKFRWVDLEK